MFSSPLTTATGIIKRGAEVEIPECAAEVLEHREQCLGMAIEYCDRAAAVADRTNA